MSDDERYLLLCMLVTFAPPGWLALSELDEHGGGRVGMKTPAGPVVFWVPPAHWHLFDWIRRTQEPFPEVSSEQTRARLREITTEFVRQLTQQQPPSDSPAVRTEKPS